MNHKWTTDDDIAVLALTKQYGNNGWDDDPLTAHLLERRGITKGSIGMAIQNFLSLLKLPGGLGNSSKRQRESFRQFGSQSPSALREIANDRLQNSSMSGAE